MSSGKPTREEFSGIFDGLAQEYYELLLPILGYDQLVGIRQLRGCGEPFHALHYLIRGADNLAVDVPGDLHVRTVTAIDALETPFNPIVEDIMMRINNYAPA